MADSDESPFTQNPDERPMKLNPEELLGRSRLTFASRCWRAELMFGRSQLQTIKDMTGFLTMLINAHENAYFYSGANLKDFPALKVISYDYGNALAGASDTSILLNEDMFKSLVTAFEAGRLCQTFVHECGHVIQHAMKLSSQDTTKIWPAFTEGLASVIGFQALRAMRYVPAGGLWEYRPDAKSQLDLAPIFIERGVRKLAEGFEGRLGIIEVGHSAGSAILEAVLFDLVYFKIAAGTPLRTALQALRPEDENEPSRAPQENFDRFFTAFGLAARRNIAPYLDAWKFDTEAIASNLAHLPPLAGELPAINATAESSPTACTPVQDSSRCVVAADGENLSREERVKARRPDACFKLVGMDELRVSLGSTLANTFLIGELSELLLDRMSDVRREIARETGVVMPGSHTCEDITLDTLDYIIHVREKLVGRGNLRIDKSLALGNEDILAQLSGEDTHEPVYGLRGKWIDDNAVIEARERGALVFDPISVLATHVGEAVRTNLETLFSHQLCAKLLEHLKTQAPALIRCVDARYSLTTVLQTLRLLLRERIWPRDYLTIFETMLNAPIDCQDPQTLSEMVRKKIVPAILVRYTSKPIPVCRIDSDFDNILCASGSDLGIPVSGDLGTRLKAALHAFTLTIPKLPNVVPEHLARATGFVRCSAKLRPVLARFVREHGLRLRVHADDEWPAEMSDVSVTWIFRESSECTAPVAQPT